MHEFTVTINKQQIAAEVRNETHKFGKGRDNGTLTPQQISNLQADDLSQDTSIINTALQLSVNRVVSELSKHISGVSPGTDIIGIDFRMSRFYPVSSDSSVESGINSYVKSSTMYEYLKLVAPNDAILYRKEAETKLTEIKQTLNYKKWRTQ